MKTSEELREATISTSRPGGVARAGFGPGHVLIDVEKRPRDAWGEVDDGTLRLAAFLALGAAAVFIGFVVLIVWRFLA